MPSMSPASNHGALAIPPSGFKRWATRMLCRNVAEQNYQQISWHAMGLFWYFFWIRLKQRLNRSNLWMRNGHHDQSWPVYGWSADRHTHTHTQTHTCCQVLWEHSSGAKSSMGCNGLSGLFDDVIRRAYSVHMTFNDYPTIYWLHSLQNN